MRGRSQAGSFLQWGIVVDITLGATLVLAFAVSAVLVVATWRGDRSRALDEGLVAELHADLWLRLQEEWAHGARQVASEAVLQTDVLSHLRAGDARATYETLGTRFNALAAGASLEDWICIGADGRPLVSLEDPRRSFPDAPVHLSGQPISRVSHVRTVVDERGVLQLVVPLHDDQGPTGWMLLRADLMSLVRGLRAATDRPVAFLPAGAGEWLGTADDLERAAAAREGRLAADGRDFRSQSSRPTSGGRLLVLHDVTDQAAAERRIDFVAGVLVLSFLAATLGVLSLLLRSRLLPLRKLAELAHEVSREHDFSRRARKIRDDEVGTLVDAFNEMLDEVEGRDRRMREQKAHSEDLAGRLAKEHQLFAAIVDLVPHPIFWKDLRGAFVGCNASFAHHAGLEDPSQIAGRTEWDMPWASQDAAECERAEARLVARAEPQLGVAVRRSDAEGRAHSYLASRVPMRTADGELFGLLGILADVTAQKELEARLAETRRLEAIGQLAAGVAHEINTPTQYATDNVRFLGEGVDELLQLVDDLHGLVPAEAAARAREAFEAADLEFLRTELPDARAHALDGLARIAAIVQAMKLFAHPGVEGMAPADLNAAVHSTVTVARGEWKYVAEMELDLDPALPLVPCRIAEINQVLLNMIVNACHAIADTLGDDVGDRGCLRIVTRERDGWAELLVSDTGAGIPDELRMRIFEPFFTTKEVGRGTGQGLALAHQAVVEGHGGTIDFESRPGGGTTFTVRLPLVQPSAHARVA